MLQLAPPPDRPNWPLPIEWLPATGQPEQLILLLHGSGGDGRCMAALAQALRSAFVQAAVLAPDWLANPPADEVAASSALLPALLAWVQAQQKRLDVAPAATAIGGFAQGATQALALVLAHDGLAGRALIFAGQLPSPLAPTSATPRHTTLHLLHGEADDQVPADAAREALRWLAERQGDATLDIAQGVGHSLHPALIACALNRLRSHIPLRTWQAALRAAAPARQPD